MPAIDYRLLGWVVVYSCFIPIGNQGRERGREGYKQSSEERERKREKNQCFFSPVNCITLSALNIREGIWKDWDLFSCYFALSPSSSLSLSLTTYCLFSCFLCCWCPSFAESWLLEKDRKQSIKSVPNTNRYDTYCRCIKICQFVNSYNNYHVLYIFLYYFNIN